jgi:hypothetical protein
MAALPTYYTATDRRAAQANKLKASLADILPHSYLVEVKQGDPDPVVEVYDAMHGRSWNLSWANSVRTALGKLLEPASCTTPKPEPEPCV